MENSAPKRKSFTEMDENSSYVSKEKYTALADEIRIWEDDLRHSRHQLCLLSQDCKKPSETLTYGRVRESLAVVAPAHVSSLCKFWERLMTEEPVTSAPSRMPFRPVQEHFQLDTPLNKSRTSDLPAPPTTAFEEEDVIHFIDDADLPSPPPISDADFLSKSVDVITSSNSPPKDFSQCPSTTQPVGHNYYNRPRMGASWSNYGRAGVLRNWPNSTNLDQTPTLPRQRSVTFEPKHGSAPGDTETESEVYEGLDTSREEGENVGESPPTPNRHLSDPQQRPLGHSSQKAQSPQQYVDSDDQCLGVIERAARLSNSASRLDRRCRRSLGETDSLDDDDDDDDAINSSLTSSSGNSSDDDSVNSEPTQRRTPQGGTSQRSSFGNDNRRRISREASALLDFECCPTPNAKTKNFSPRKTDLEDINAAVVARRLARIKEVSGLLEVEKTQIMDLSGRLSESQLSVKSSGKRDSAKNMPVSRDADFVKLSQQFLLACQRRQALMEELVLLHKGLPVQVPEMRGEPLRARFQLHSIRLGLKSASLIPSAPSALGGYVLIGMGASGVPTTPYDFIASPIDGSYPTKFHILAILKCIGEGRIYHTQTATLMRVADLPPGSARPVSYIDLLADIDIVPLQPEFLISIEVYCLKVSGATHTPMNHTGASSSGSSSSSASKRTRTVGAQGSPAASTKKCGGFQLPFPFSTGRKKKYTFSSQISGVDSSPAFTLLSSVGIKHHDELLFGRLPSFSRDRYLQARRDDLNNVAPSPSTAPTGMPLFLEGLPKSCPLGGPLGLNQASVRLQSAVLKRGFLTIFEESGGMGVWTRCWCKLLADQIVYWRYPEDEEGRPPIGRMDLRHVVAPWAVEAPRKICVRANTLLMRSLVSTNPKWLLSTDQSVNSSILLHASSDYKWLEQRHLICADSDGEMHVWLKLINKSLEALRRWMPAHFACLSRYDAKSTFTQSVSAGVAHRLKCLGQTLPEGSPNTNLPPLPPASPSRSSSSPSS